MRSEIDMQSKTAHSALCLLATCLLFLTRADAHGQNLLLKNARLIDPQKESIRKVDLLIVDGRISDDKNRSDRARKDLQVLDLSGKWVIPELIDLHVHCGANALPDGTDEYLGATATAHRMLYAGVCAYLDLANGRYERLFALRDEQRQSRRLASDQADIYCAGTPFARWSFSSPAAVPQTIVNYVKKFHPDVIKLIYAKNTLDVPTLRRAIWAAKVSHVKTVVHIGSWEHAEDAIAAGATAVTHFFDDEVVPDKIARLWANRHTVSIPTLAVQMDMARLSKQPQLLKSKLLTDLEPEYVLKTYREESKLCKKAKETLSWQLEDARNERDSFRKLKSLGVTILAGSDTNNLGTFQGFSLHREIKLMQECGYSPGQALRAATTGAQKFLGRASGTKPGDYAELVVLEGNPLTDVANTQKVFAVIHHGRLVDRESLLVKIRKETEKPQ